jgi:hypothetical protein
MESKVQGEMHPSMASLVICNYPSEPPHNSDSFSLIVFYLLEDEASK